MEKIDFKPYLLSFTPNPVIVYNYDVSVKYVNQAFEKLTGYELSQIKGMKQPFPWWPENIHSLKLEDFQREMEGGISRKQRRFIDSNGSQFWVEINTNPVPDDGAPFFFISNWVDITPNKRMEIALKHIAQTTAAITGTTFFETLTMKLAEVLDVKYVLIAKVVHKPEAIARTLTLWNGEELSPPIEYSLNGTPCAELYVDNDVCFFPSKVQQLFPEDKILVDMQAQSYIGSPIFHSNGELLGHIAVLDTRPMSDSKENIAGIVKLFSTRIGAEMERLDYEQQLRESEDKLVSIIDSVPDSMLMIDKQLRINWCNDVAMKTFGFELIGQKCHNVLVGSDEQCSLCIVRDCFKDGKIHQNEIDMKSADGRMRTFWCTVRVGERDNRGRPRMIVHNARDITDRKASEENMKAQRDLSLSLSAASDMESALDLILYTATKVSGMDSACIFILDEKTNLYRHMASQGLSPEFLKSMDLLDPESPKGQIISSDKIRFSNLQKDKNISSILSPEERSEGIKAIALLPILHGGRVIASLNVSSHSLEKVPDDVRSFLETIASQMASTLARLRAEDSLRESEYEKTVLNRIADIFLTTSSDEMYSGVLEVVREALSSRFGIFGYIDENSDYICPSMTRDIFEKCNVPDKQIIFSNEKWSGIWGDSLKTGKSQISNSPLPVPEGHIPIERVMSVPVIHDELLIGNFVTANKETDYVDKDLKLLESIADYVAPVLHSRLLNERNENERRKAEEALKKLSYAVSHSPSLIMITDSEGNIEYVNPAFSRTTGYSLEEVAGKNPRFLKSGYFPPVEYEQLWKTISSGHEWRGEFQNRKKNGDLYWEFGSILPVTNDDGKIIHYIGIKEDITEKKAIDEEMNRLMGDMEVLVKQVEEKNDELEAFTYSVSHDLKSPLVTIDGFARVIEEEYGDAIGDDGIRYLDKIIRASGKMKALINDLLDYSRIGRFVEEQEEVSFIETVRDAMDMLRHMADERGIKMNIEKKDTVLYGEKSRLAQVFQNLINNAIKYIGEDNPAPVINIGFKDMDGEKVFFVTDNGMGIDLNEENKTRIFNMFQRLTTYMSQESSGVGLAIVKRIVESHNGRIWVESELGKGSSFFFTNG